MIKSFIKPALASLAAIALIAAVTQVQAEDKKTAADQEIKKPEAATPPEVAQPTKPWRGNLISLDKTNMTVTVKKKTLEKTFQVTASTKIKKADKSRATLAEFADQIGEPVVVYYKNNDDGKAEALALRVSVKPDAEGGDGKDTTKKAGKAEGEKKAAPSAGETEKK